MIAQHLQWAFGEEAVFFDRSSITAGAKWPDTLRQAASACRACVVVIGKAWLAAVDGSGRPRLENDDDWVRHEVRTALNSDATLLIPVLIDGASVPPSSALPSDLAPLTERQFRVLNELPEFEGDLSEVVEAISAKLGVPAAPFTSTERKQLVDRELATPDGENRARILQKVREAWIDGVLVKALQGSDSFSLGLEYAPTAVVRPRGIPESPLRDTRDIAEVFLACERQLLILGSPGAGKTILLLQLASSCLHTAERDLKAPIPVVLNLSSWSAKRLKLREWLFEDLRAVYQVPVAVGRDWVEGKRLLLLLDGLDEVGAVQVMGAEERDRANVELRQECLQAINDFIDEFPSCPIAVCSRLRDFEELKAQVRLRAAVTLQALDLDRAYTLLQGSDYAALREIAQREPEFQAMLTVPFLLNLARIAYRSKTVAQLTLPPSDDVTAGRREDIFETYIEAQFDSAERSTRRPSFRRHVVRASLTWLAQRMQQRAHSVFYVENLQYDWLPGPYKRMTYLVASSLLYGSIVGFFGGLAGAAISGVPNPLSTSSHESFEWGGIVSGAIGMSGIGALLFLQGAFARACEAPLQRFSFEGGIFKRCGVLCAWAVIIWISSVAVSGLLLLMWHLLSDEKMRQEIFGGGLIYLILFPIGAALFLPALLLVMRGIQRMCRRLPCWQPWMAAPALAFILSYLIFMLWLEVPWSELVDIEWLAAIVPLAALVAFVLRLSSIPEIDVRMVERLAWRWNWKAAIGSALVGGVIGVFAENLDSIKGWRDSGSIVALGVTGLIFGGVWGGIHKNERVARRRYPGQGLNETVRNSFLLLFLYMLTGAAILAFANPFISALQDYKIASQTVPIAEKAVGGLIGGAGLGAVVGLYLGGADALIKHWILRAQTKIHGLLPFRLVRFLDYGTQCLLLRRVGAGYIFLHRYLLEHFASRCRMKQ